MEISNREMKNIIFHRFQVGPLTYYKQCPKISAAVKKIGFNSFLMKKTKLSHVKAPLNKFKIWFELGLSREE